MERRGDSVSKNNTHGLRELVDRFGQHLDYYKRVANGYNEHSCRIEYIDPFLKMLGWDVDNQKGLPPQFREVIAENYSSETERPDYSLTLRGVAKLFVEAKKPSVDINIASNPAFQARKYGWNAGHKISILTNFEWFIIYDTTAQPKDGDKSSVARYRKYHFTEYAEKFHEIQALTSRDIVYSGAFDDFYTKELFSKDSQKTQIDQVFLKEINDWRLCIGQSLYQCGGKYLNIEILNDAVQSLINQIVYLRICEDRNLPTYHKLCEIVSDDSTLAQEMITLLQRADRRYNSGLFEDGSYISDIDIPVLQGIISSLYYPQSPYLFSIIDSGLFGRIYELFLTERLVVDENGEIDLRQKTAYVDRSVVATPVEIVKYIVEKALLPLCEGKNPNEMLNLKIADISCGSGVFLIEAFDYLCAKFVEWYTENDPTHLIDIGNGLFKLPLEEKKAILINCLYGIDVDIHAVEVAKFSLLIKLIEDETTPSVTESTPILPCLNDSVIFGNSLVSPDDLSGISLVEEDLVKIAPLDWTSVNHGEGFSAIVGNPPYSKTEDMHALLPSVEIEVYKSIYKTSYKQFDKYFIFLEQAISKVVQGGYICFIVPNKFFKIGSGKELRRLITTDDYLVSIDDFGDMQLFGDKTIYVCILCLQTKQHDTFNYAAVGIPDALWGGEEPESIELESSHIGASPWQLTTDIGYFKQFKTMEKKGVSLEKHVHFFNGIQTSAETHKNYWFSDGEILHETDQTITYERHGKHYTIERRILKPYFKPTQERGFNSYSTLNCDKKIIFPYDDLGELLSPTQMQIYYPGTWGYLLDQYTDLLPKALGGKRDVDGATEDTWYQYGRSQSLTAFQGDPKLIIGILSKEPLYYYDAEDWVIASGGTAGYCAARIKNDSPYCFEYIQAWLTSSHTEKYFEMMGSDFEGGYKSRGTALLKKVPFIEIDLENQNYRTLYDDVVVNTRRVYEINHRLKTVLPKNQLLVLNREKTGLTKRIEKSIDSIYEMGLK